jgi:two-component system chemotaxis response regulator CheY
MSVTAAAHSVLIADDSAANRLTLRLELMDRGLEVIEAESGTEAIGKLGDQRFAAVVTDVWMPGADGIAVVQSIRRLAPETPVFVITGGGPGLTIASAAALAETWGAVKVYVKPFDVRLLVDDLVALLPA